MAAVSSEAVPAARHQLAQRLRAAVLGPRGGGTTRRRASDAFRLGFAVIVVAVSIPVMKASSAAELRIVHAVHPPPTAISWLVSTVFWLGLAGVSVLLVIVGLLVRRPAAVRWAAVAAVATWGVCIVLGVLLGPAAGRPPVSELAGVNAGYPGHAARGRDRRGGDRASVSEPPGAPAGVGPTDVERSGSMSGWPGLVRRVCVV